MTTPSEEWLALLREAVEKGAAVFHLPSGVISPAKAVHGPGEWTSKINGRPVESDVLELDSGDTFIARVEVRDNFRILSKREESFASTASAGLSSALQHLVQFSASTGILPELTADLLVAIIARQAKMLAAPPAPEVDPG